MWREIEIQRFSIVLFVVKLITPDLYLFPVKNACTNYIMYILVHEKFCQCQGAMIKVWGCPQLLLVFRLLFTLGTPNEYP